jgi:tetratricopeptide (TPR) repeat protein
VFWVHASTKARFEEGYRGIADKLELPRRNEPAINVLQLVRDWLRDEANGKWTMVLDNADDIEVFYPKRKRARGGSQDIPAPLAVFLPQSHNGSILITSRSKDAAVRLAGSYKNIKEVHAMDRGQALQLLRNKLEDASDEGGAADLLNNLDYIPLAITQAAAFINRRAPRMTISSYIVDFRKSDEKKVKLLNEDAGDLRRDESASNSVVTTWQMSFEHVRRERRSAADLLSLMSFFNPQGIPESVLRRHSANATARTDSYNVDDIDDDGEFNDDLDTLRAYSLVTAAADNGICEMHQLVQFCTKVWLSSFDEVERWRRKFYTLMAREFPDGSFKNWVKCQVLLPHVESILEREPADEGLLGDWAQVLSNTAWYMWIKGNYKTAESMAVKAITTRERIKGRDDLRTLTSISILAVVLQHQGKYEAAEEMDRRALEGREKVLGKEHPNTLASVGNLALVLRYQGKYEAAERMNRRALEGREKVLGKEHPDTLSSVGNLALVLQYQGKHKAAEQMNRRALEGREKVLGKDHPDTLVSVGNLAGVLRYQGKYKAAEQMNRRALKWNKKVLGKEHPSTLTSVGSLASVLQYQGKYEAAEEMNRRALEGREKVLGKEHPDTLASMGNLASILRYQGKYKAAEEMNQRALEGHEKVLGKEHPNTLTNVGNLALVLQYQGRYEAAEEMSRRALEGREKVLGKEHPNTLTSVGYLALALSNQGKYAEAEKMYRETLALREKVLGKEHPLMLASMSNLVGVLSSQGKYAEAEKMHQETLALREKMLGKERRAARGNTRRRRRCIERRWH